MIDRSRDYILLAGLQLFLLLFHTRSFLSTVKLAGRDLVGAYSLVKTFGFGWSTDWFLGFPMFRFYPPGFFATATAAGSIAGDLTAFKLLLYLLLLAVPPSVYYSFSNLFDRRTGLIAGFLAVFLTFLRPPFSLVYQTLQVGLVAQAAALPFLLLFLGTIWRDGRGQAYLSALLFALTTITHPFLGTVAGAYALLHFAAEKNISRLFFTGLGGALTAWWWIPALEKSWYIQLYTGPSGKLVNLPWLFLPFLALDRGRKALTLAFLGLFLLFLGTFELFPMQYYRAFIYGQLLTVLAAAPGLSKAVEKTFGRVSPETITYLIGLSILIASLTVTVEPHWSSTTDMEGVMPDDGQVIVETSKPDLYESYVPIQTIPLKSNASVVNGLYADSSISSPYLLGLEKSIAKNPIPNPIAVDANLTQKQIRKRMAYLDIEHALVRTSYARERLSFMNVSARNRQFTLLTWNPEFDRTVENPVRFHGSRKEWRQLNEEIFRNRLNTSYVYTEEKLEEVTIGEESRKPSGEGEAVFGLSITQVQQSK